MRPTTLMDLNNFHSSPLSLLPLHPLNLHRSPTVMHTCNHCSLYVRLNLDVCVWVCVCLRVLNISLSHRPECSQWTAQLRQRNGFKCCCSAHTARQTTQTQVETNTDISLLWELLTNNIACIYSKLSKPQTLSNLMFPEQNWIFCNSIKRQDHRTAGF